jgi:GNAT superfamily N-acetyltransferase
MDQPRMLIEDDPDERTAEEVQHRLYAYDRAITGVSDYRPLGTFLRDAQGALVGGLTGYTWGGVLKVAFLWVREDARRHGSGSQLLAAAEAEARARGCAQSVLETHSYQAPDFYRHRGYQEVGRIEDFPRGHTLFIFRKRL